MTEQELVDRGICGVIAQGYIERGVFQRIDVEVVNAEPCRCLVGHMIAVPVGERLDRRDIHNAGGWSFREQLYRIHDNAVDLDDLRHRLSAWLTERGMDDACCWWEVAS